MVAAISNAKVKLKARKGFQVQHRRVLERKGLSEQEIKHALRKFKYAPKELLLGPDAPSGAKDLLAAIKKRKAERKKVRAVQRKAAEARQRENVAKGLSPSGKKLTKRQKLNRAKYEAKAKEKEEKAQKKKEARRARLAGRAAGAAAAEGAASPAGGASAEAAAEEASPASEDASPASAAAEAAAAALVAEADDVAAQPAAEGSEKELRVKAKQKKRKPTSRPAEEDRAEEQRQQRKEEQQPEEPEVGPVSAAGEEESLADAQPSTSAVAEESPGDAGAGKLSKAERKARKALLRAAAAQEATAAVPEAAPTPLGDPSAPSPTQQKPKKRRKPLAEAAAASEGGQQPRAEAGAQVAKKKRKERTQGEEAGAADAKKKMRRAEQEAAPAQTPAAGTAPATGTAPQWASVGDQELARRGKPLVKDLYRPHPAVAGASAAHVAEWRAERSVGVQGAEGPGANPVEAFEHAGFSPELLEATRDFQTPSPIQAQCWPLAAAGRDVVGIAATGSGKTLAFGLPGLQHVAAQRKHGVLTGKGPGMLVVAPTRELALQIEGVLAAAGAPAGMTSVCVYGGVPKGPQAQALRGGVDAVVGTPGRLQDLLQDGALTLAGVSCLVLDEADRMLDLGFEPEIRGLAGRTRADRQTLMFSATWPPAIRRLAAEFLSHPARVTIGSADLSASHSVRQVVEVLEQQERYGRLGELLQKYHGGAKQRANRVLVFALYKKEAAQLEARLRRDGWQAGAVHGDLSQDQRTRAVNAFRDGSQPLLVATDVAARGLDIPDVEAVLNFSFPLTTEDYVHRIGRTGRAGKTGLAHTFFCGATDKPRAGELINVLREAGQPVPPELLRFGTTVKKKESKLYGAHFKELDYSQKASKKSFDSDDE